MIKHYLNLPCYNVALFETTKDPSRYYLYDIETEKLFEITKEEYQQFKDAGAWSNLVFSEDYIQYMINLCHKENKKYHIEEIIENKVD